MENRIPLALLLFFMLAGIAVIPGIVLGYSQTTTHPALTDEIVDYYNLVFRSGDTSSLREITFWAVSSSAQSILTKNLAGLFLSTVDDPGDFSWERALKDYAKGDEKRAFTSLGHVLHLLKDASVPEHTRDDTHIGHGQFGSPLENWAEKFTRSNLELAPSLYAQGLKPLIKNSVEEYFDEVAAYSNNYFFSEDTILSSLYPTPIFSEFKNELINGEYYNFAYGVDEDNHNFRLFLKLRKPIKRNLGDKLLTLGDENFLILSDYWTRLSRKAVLAGAGAVELFLRDAKIARGLYRKEAEKKKGLFDWFAGMFGDRGIGEDAHALAAAVEAAKSEGAAGNSSSASSPDEDITGKTEEHVPHFSAIAEKCGTCVQGSDLLARESPVPVKAEKEKQEEALRNEPEKEDDSITSGNQKTASKKIIASSSKAEGSGGGGGEGAFCPLTGADAPLRSVLLNEIAWSGSAVSFSDEWIELY
ncbi:MAG: hypothetical protein HY006_00470, partial [Candidatus Sungbacteria bacterium]|nr:hypothetical protein [Candidatus Sungbacteria bacterium]